MRKDDALVELADIKKDLPHGPDEVIKPWLLKLANRGTDTEPRRKNGVAERSITRLMPSLRFTAFRPEIHTRAASLAGTFILIVRSSKGPVDLLVPPTSAKPAQVQSIISLA